MKLSLSQQKYIIMGLLFSINILLATTFIIYEDKQYVYLFILAFGSLINTSSVLLILYDRIIKKIPYDKIHRETPQTYLYVIRYIEVDIS